MSRGLSVLILTAVLVAFNVGALADDAPDAVRIALDWTPNTNHTGIFVALDLGFFADEGLDVIVLQPGPTASIPLVASGRAEFGVSVQEYVTMNRAQGVPVVSIATLFQHNTSGFAAPRSAGISSPVDFEHRRYAGWGSDLETVTIRTVMESVGADFSTVEMVNIGTMDFATAVRRDFADFMWIFYGWQGIHAQLEDIDFVYLPVADFDDALEYYTPLIISSEAMIAENPDIVTRFARALRLGYVHAILKPDEAADILLKYAPELDPDLVHASQQWIAEQTLDEIDGWGLQEERVWAAFADWALVNALLDRPIDPTAAFTNRFLEEGESE